MTSDDIDVLQRLLRRLIARATDDETWALIKLARTDRRSAQERAPVLDNAWYVGPASAPR